MRINWKKTFTAFIDFWKQVCMVFFAFIGLFCFQATIMLLFNGKNLLVDTSLLFPPLCFLFLTILFSSGTIYIIAYENSNRKIEVLRKTNDRLKKDNLKKLKMITELGKTR